MPFPIGIASFKAHQCFPRMGCFWEFKRKKVPTGGDDEHAVAVLWHTEVRRVKRPSLYPILWLITDGYLVSADASVVVSPPFTGFRRDRRTLKLPKNIFVIGAEGAPH